MYERAQRKYPYLLLPYASRDQRRARPRLPGVSLHAIRRRRSSFHRIHLGKMAPRVLLFFFQHGGSALGCNFTASFREGQNSALFLGRPLAGPAIRLALQAVCDWPVAVVRVSPQRSATDRAKTQLMTDDGDRHVEPLPPKKSIFYPF